MRHAAPMAVLAALLALAPGSARAALDLETLDLEVKVEGTKGVDTVFQVTVSVTGTDIKTAKLTRGGTPAASVDLACGSATSCSLQQNLANQAALDALIPTSSTSYTIDLTGTDGTSTVTGTFAYARPAVPSPAISAPVDGTTIEPGEIALTFSACSVCSSATQGTVLEGGNPFEEKLDLPASATSWTPTTPFPANSSFTAKIVHATQSSQGQTADGPGSGTTDDSYTFTSRVTHSDSIAFKTGFASPVGDFCIIVNDPPAAPFPIADCDGYAYINAPAAGVFDPSGDYLADAAGIPVAYSLQLTPQGRLTGIANADVDGNGSFETPGQLKGRLKGKDGRLKQGTRTRFGTGGSDTRFTLKLREQAELASLASATTLSWLVDQTTKGKAQGVKLSERTSYTRVVPDAVTGWKLWLSLSNSNGAVTGRVDLASGLSAALGGKQSFDPAANRSDVRLQSQGAERGVKVRVKKLVIDTAQLPDAQIGSGDVRFKGFGQRANVLLP